MLILRMVVSQNKQKKIWKQNDIKWNVQFVAIIWIFVWTEDLRF